MSDKNYKLDEEFLAKGSEQWAIHIGLGVIIRNLASLPDTNEAVNFSLQTAKALFKDHLTRAYFKLGITDQGMIDEYCEINEKRNWLPEEYIARIEKYEVSKQG